MLIDSVQGLREFHNQFRCFLVSSAHEASFSAIMTGDPAPYYEFFAGLRVKKSESSMTLSLSADRWLELSASPEYLAEFCENLIVEEDGVHHHWYSSPVALIIEADNWRAKQITPPLEAG